LSTSLCQKCGLHPACSRSRIDPRLCFQCGTLAREDEYEARETAAARRRRARDLGLSVAELDAMIEARRPTMPAARKGGAR